jgi:hypothetical protein
MLVLDKGKYFGFQIQVHILGYGNLEEQEIKTLQFVNNLIHFLPYSIYIITVESGYVSDIFIGKAS